jgi:hypothetical protein
MFANIGLRYEMATLIPPQFDKYGTTFWIPSQVEPTVAIIGTSLPAFRQFVSYQAKRITDAYYSYSKSTSKPESSTASKVGTSTGPGGVQVIESARRGSSSGAPLTRNQYYELTDKDSLARSQ